MGRIGSRERLLCLVHASACMQGEASAQLTRWAVDVSSQSSQFGHSRALSLRRGCGTLGFFTRSRDARALRPSGFCRLDFKAHTVTYRFYCERDCAMDARDEQLASGVKSSARQQIKLRSHTRLVPTTCSRKPEESAPPPPLGYACMPSEPSWASMRSA
eukprot:3461659-Pleurochrysis_carterae.AAC.4